MVEAMTHALKKSLATVLVASALMLSACSSTDTEKEKKPDDRPVESLYNEASTKLESKSFEEAARGFEEVERLHPYSPWAIRAELMAAYSYYKGTNYDEAVVALDRFAELHPGNKDVDYALYLKALCYYEQISDVARDQAMTREALASFEALIRRFPESRYSRDATFKRDLTLDHLAGKEMEIGRYYLRRGETNAALNRFRTVVTDYQTTTHAPEALHRLVEGYLTLGLKDEAVKVAAVLGYNYPGSKWYEASYKLLDPALRKRLEEDRGFKDRAIDTLFKPD